MSDDMGQNMENVLLAKPQRFHWICWRGGLADLYDYQSMLDYRLKPLRFLVAIQRIGVS
jgi:hypothetical protein